MALASGILTDIQNKLELNINIKALSYLSHFGSFAEYKHQIKLESVPEKYFHMLR